MKNITCPRPECGYVGKPRRKDKGSILVALFLLCCGIVPGIVYLAATSGCRYYCPKCGVLIDTD